MTKRRGAGLFLVALAPRLAHVGAIHGSPLFRRLFIDSEFYDGVGRRLASGEGFPDGPFFMNVLHGLFLGAVYAIFGADERGRLAALLVQAALGAASVVLLARLGEALGRPRDGFAAAVLLAMWGPAIFYDGALLTPSLLLFLTTLVAWCAVRSVAHAKPDAPRAAAVRSAAALGLVTGLLILGRATHVLLLCGWILALAPRGRRGREAALVVAATAALVVLPVTLRNARASGEFVPVTTNGGMALWAGHHEGATGIYSQPAFLSNPVPEREAEDYRAEASRRAGRPLTLAQSSAYWTRAAIDRTFAEPAAALRLLARKIRLYFHATEAQTNLSYYFARDFSSVLDVLRLHLGWILPLVLLGLAVGARGLAVPLVPVAVSFLTCITFYVSSEYRHPVVPCLLLLAAAGARWAFGVWRRGSAWRRIALAGALAFVFFATNARDGMLARLQSRRIDYLNFATLAATAGDLGEAERFARESVAIDPAWATSRRKLAEILAARGRMREAAAESQAASALPGGSADPLAPAHALFRDGRYADALAAFLDVAARGGDGRATAMNNAGLCAMRLERFDEAESLLVRAVEADPAYTSPIIHLGRLALARGDSAAAAEQGRRALALAPGDARAARLLARATGTPLEGEPAAVESGD